MEYVELSVRKPDDGEMVWTSACKDPMLPIIGIYRNGKFYYAGDESVEMFPKYWKYPDVPFAF